MFFKKDINKVHAHLQIDRTCSQSLFIITLNAGRRLFTTAHDAGEKEVEGIFGSSTTKINNHSYQGCLDR